MQRKPKWFQHKTKRPSWPVAIACALMCGAWSLPGLAIVGGVPAETDNNALVFVEAIFAKEGERLPCSGVLVSEDEVYTAGHCLVREETGQKASQIKVCVGRRKPFSQPGEACFVSRQFYVQVQQGNTSTKDIGIIRLPEPVPVYFLGMDTARLMASKQELALIEHLAEKRSAPPLLILSFGARSFASPSVGKKGMLQKGRLSWSPRSNSWMVSAEHAAKWIGDDGAALMVRWQGKWRLLGMLTDATPDMFYSVEPFFDPCQPPQTPPRQPSLLLTSKLRFASLNLSRCRSQACEASFHKISQKVMQRRLAEKNADALLAYAESLKAENQVQALHEAAMAGSGKAALRLFFLYDKGTIVPRNDEKARKWLEKALALGEPQALWLASRIMPNKRMQYLEKAAKKGHKQAQLAWAKLHADSPSEYYTWLMRSARQGEPEAQFLLAQSFFDGYGVRQDDYIGRQWMKYAAGLGYVPAQTYLESHPDPLLDHYAIPEE